MKSTPVKSAIECFPSDPDDWKSLRAAARSCTCCPLYKNATRTVFGEGSPRSKLIIVGEQPGNEEDIEGKPFVGPSGKLLRSLLDGAGLKESDVYFTNAVKHFKFKRSGKRRIHERPSGVEIKACRAWLEAEISVVKPKVIVCLGATAGLSVFGRAVKVNAERGKVVPLPQFHAGVLLTFHPSAVLRSPSEELRHRMKAELLSDLIKAKKYLTKQLKVAA